MERIEERKVPVDADDFTDEEELIPEEYFNEDMNEVPI